LPDPTSSLGDAQRRPYRLRRSGTAWRLGDVEVYPTILEKAEMLLERLARNHALPDGNNPSRSSWPASFWDE
jgi:hypothetical protein